MEGAYLFHAPDRAFLRISGTDATRWLNGMVTNSIQVLQPGDGNYNFLLNAQGRIQGDCTIYREPWESPTFLLATSADQIDTIQALLDRFIIMDDVELTRAYEEEESLFLFGADAPSLLGQIGLPIVDSLKMMHASTSQGQVLILTSFGRLSLQFELRGSRTQIGNLAARATAIGASNITSHDWEAIRIASGEPRFSVDIRDRDLPQETNQTHALHFAKGCYLGQEIIERIRSRGQVHRLFTTFQLQGAMPGLPTALELNGKPAGELTSAAQLGNDIYALGYARREALEGKQPFTYSGGTATPRVTATAARIQQHEKTNG